MVKLCDRCFGKWLVETHRRTIGQTIERTDLFRCQANQLARSIRLSQIAYQSDRRIR